MCIKMFHEKSFYIADLVDKTKAYDTKNSQAVTHPSTNFARQGLTSVIRREPVLSLWYGRRHFFFLIIIHSFFNRLLTAMAVLNFKYFRGLRANGLFQSNTAIILSEILLFYFTRGSSFCITSPDLNVISLGNCHESQNSVSIVFIGVFLSHFQLQKPPGGHHKARMVGRGNLLKEARRER